MKYKLTNNKKTVLGTTFYQIEATASFGSVSKGQLGGWIEEVKNLSRVLGIHHDTTATVHTNPAYLTIRAGRGHVETFTTFDISKPLSPPPNTAACEAVLKLLDSDKV